MILWCFVKEMLKCITRSSLYVISFSVNSVDDMNVSECVCVEFENYFVG